MYSEAHAEDFKGKESGRKSVLGPSLLTFFPTLNQNFPYRLFVLFASHIMNTRGQN